MGAAHEFKRCLRVLPFSLRFNNKESIELNQIEEGIWKSLLLPNKYLIRQHVAITGLIALYANLDSLTNTTNGIHLLSTSAPFEVTLLSSV